MWNAIQGVANKASKLAVEVLDAGPHDNGKPIPRPTPSTTVTFQSDRLSALKARYKAPDSDDLSPKQETSAVESTVDESHLSSEIEDNHETIKLKTQLEKLKMEMMRQHTISEDQLKQQNYQSTEKLREMETNHRLQLDQSREEIRSYFQGLLDEKESELRGLRSGGNVSVEELTEENLRLKSELHEAQQRGIDEVFREVNTHEVDQSGVVRKLEQDYENLRQQYQQLEERNSLLISPEALIERDVFWHKEIQKLQMQSTDEEEIYSLRQALDQEKLEKTEVVQHKEKMEEEISRLGNSLQERDSIWQEELVSHQNMNLQLKRDFEAVKLEYQEMKEQNMNLEAAVKKLDMNLKNEGELRTAAESHVRSLQKNMMEVDSGSSTLRQQLLESQKQMEEMKIQLERELQDQKQKFQVQLADYEANKQQFAELNGDLTERLGVMKREKEELGMEVDSLKKRYLASGEEIDVSKLSYEFESVTENLRLAQSRNSLLTHEVEALNKELVELRQEQVVSRGAVGEDPGALGQLEKERDGYKTQLKRLKQQLIQMEEDQEASIHWRIDAEVKLALEAYKKQEEGPKKDHVVSLESSFEQAKEEVEFYKKENEEKRKEISNLQIALGELTYHGEAADKLRRDLKLAHEEIKNLKEEILEGKVAVAEGNSARKAAEEAADLAHQQISKSEEKIIHLESNLFTTKKELLEVSQKLQRLGNDADSMVDRRLVVQLLVAYLEKRNSKDALEVMARMLGFTEEEKQKIGVKTSRGFLGSVAGGTLALMKGGMSVATLGLLDRGLNSKAGSQLADQWVDFLTKETDTRTPQEQDPLAYLQQAPTAKWEPRSELMDSTQSQPQSPTQYYLRPSQSPSLSSRSDVAGPSSQQTGSTTEAKISTWKNPAVNPLQPYSGSIPSFKDFIEQQQHSSS